MPTKNKPLTQAQFDKKTEKILKALKKKADKKDVEKIAQEMIDANMILVANAFEKVATKEDLKEALKDYPTRVELEETLQKALAPYATKEDMKEIMESLAERFESSVFATLRNHETRITTLEQA